MISYMFGAKPLSDPMLAHCQFKHWEQISNKNTTIFIQQNEFENVHYFASASMG